MFLCPTLETFYEKVCSECLPPVPLFGQPLEKYMEIQKKSISFLNEPWIVKKSCDYLRSKGLKTEGIFRVPGSTSVIQKVSDMFDLGKNPDYNYELNLTVEDVAGTLKKYLREQPDPLFSDGTSEDQVQSDLLNLMSTEDESTIVVGLHALLKKLSIYRITLLTDLFNLLESISINSHYNKMSPDNLATIFGGMMDIISNQLSPVQRTQLTRIMIKNYDKLFEYFFTVQNNSDSIKDLDETTRDGVRIYLHDGTFKSLYCTGAETVRTFQRKMMSKLQATTDIIKTNGYRFFEVYDSFWRRIGNDEKILGIYKSGSAILFTDRLQFGGRLMKKITCARSVKSSPSERSFLEVKGNDVSFCVYLFELSRNFEGSACDQWPNVSRFTDLLIVRQDADTNIIEIIANFKGDICHFSINDVELDPNSSRLFILHSESSPQKNIAIAFQDRQTSIKFIKLLQSLGNNTLGLIEPCEIRCDVAPLSVIRFYSGPLPPSCHLEDGFYDGGQCYEGSSSLSNSNTGTPVSMDQSKHTHDADKPRTLESFDRDLMDLNKCETLVVDAQIDQRLNSLYSAAFSLVQTASSTTQRIQLLSMYISNVMGGIDTSQGLSVIDKNVLYEHSLHMLTKINVRKLKQLSITNIIKIGHLQYGVSRHRAILFKYIADRLEPPIPTYLLRSIQNDEYDFYWNIVPNSVQGQFSYLDLMHDPGKMYELHSSTVLELVHFLRGPLPSEISLSIEKNKASVARRSSSISVSLPFVIKNLRINPPSPPMSNLLSPAIDEDLTQPIPNDVNTQHLSIQIEDISQVTHHSLISRSKNKLLFRSSWRNLTIAVKMYLHVTQSNEVNSDRSSSIPSEINNPLNPITLEHLKQCTQGRMELNHKNHIRVFGYRTHHDHFYIFQEYVGASSLNSILDTSLWLPPLSDPLIWHCIHKISSGLDYLHQRSWYHGNLKPMNILLDGPLFFDQFQYPQSDNVNIRSSNHYGYNQVKHCSFGKCEVNCTDCQFYMSTEHWPIVKLTDPLLFPSREINCSPSGVVLGDQQNCHRYTNSYLAPEILNHNHMQGPLDIDVATASDIWSLGKVLLEMLIGKGYQAMLPNSPVLQSSSVSLPLNRPADQNGASNHIVNIEELLFDLSEQSPFKPIIRACCAPDYKARPKASQLVQIASKN